MGLNKNKMNYYFYAPEIKKHRLNWNDYKNEWTKNFKKFCDIARKKCVKTIVGISPGYDFDFSEFLMSNSENKMTKDLKNSLQKFRYFLEQGVDEIALLFDDLPNNFK